jgi:hypothetical protein
MYQKYKINLQHLKRKNKAKARGDTNNTPYFRNKLGATKNASTVRISNFPLSCRPGRVITFRGCSAYNQALASQECFPHLSLHQQSPDLAPILMTKSYSFHYIRDYQMKVASCIMRII